VEEVLYESDEWKELKQSRKYLTLNRLVLSRYLGQPKMTLNTAEKKAKLLFEKAIQAKQARSRKRTEREREYACVCVCDGQQFIALSGIARCEYVRPVAVPLSRETISEGAPIASRSPSHSHHPRQHRHTHPFLCL
jgi:hypothetical protein